LINTLVYYITLVQIKCVAKKMACKLKNWVSNNKRKACLFTWSLYLYRFIYLSLKVNRPFPWLLSHFEPCKRSHHKTRCTASDNFTLLAKSNLLSKEIHQNLKIPLRTIQRNLKKKTKIVEHKGGNGCSP